MIEILLVLALVGALGGVVALAAAAPEYLFFAGAALSLLGLLAGLPASAWYHHRLRHVLVERGPLPPRWWLNPTGLHAALSPSQRRFVKPAFVTGAATFLAAIAGALLVVIAMIRWR